MRRWVDELSIPAGFAALIVLAGAAGYYLVRSEFDLVMRGLTALGILLLAFFFYGNSTAIKGSVGARQIKYGSNTFVMVVAFIAILALGNVLVARNTHRWDLTASKDFSLSDQSVKVLASVKEPVEIVGFFTAQSGAQKQQVQDLLKEYSVRSDKISSEFIDPDVKPGEAQKYQIRYDGTLLVMSGERRQEVTAGDPSNLESDISSAILKVTSGEQKRVAFLTGHGERSIDSFDRSGYGQVKTLLEGNNYKVETINLTTNPTLTTDIAVLVVASPRSALLDHEKETIKQYLDTGGRMLLLADPNVDVNLNDVIEKWGVEVGKGTAVDQSMAFLGDVGTLVIQQYRYSPITKDLNGMAAVLPLATDVKTKNPAPEGMAYTTLFEITDKGWVEMDPRVAKFDESVDIKGPVPLAVSVQEQGKPGDPSQKDQSQPRLVVFGDSDFLTSGFLATGANSDLLINSVNWLAQSEQMISIKPKQPQDRSLVLTNAQGSFVLFSSVVLLPGIVLAAGAAVWWRRR